MCLLEHDSQQDLEKALMTLMRLQFCWRLVLATEDLLIIHAGRVFLNAVSWH